MKSKNLPDCILIVFGAAGWAFFTVYFSQAFIFAEEDLLLIFAPLMVLIGLVMGTALFLEFREWKRKTSTYFASIAMLLCFAGGAAIFSLVFWRVDFFDWVISHA